MDLASITVGGTATGTYLLTTPQLRLYLVVLSAVIRPTSILAVSTPCHHVFHVSFALAARRPHASRLLSHVVAGVDCCDKSVNDLTTSSIDQKEHRSVTVAASSLSWMPRYVAASIAFFLSFKPGPAIHYRGGWYRTKHFFCRQILSHGLN